jgi:hypothetical protein
MIQFIEKHKITLLLLTLLAILILVIRNWYKLLFNSYDYLQIPLLNSDMKRLLQDEKASKDFRELVEKEQNGKLEASDYLYFEGRKYRLKRSGKTNMVTT